MDEIEMGTTRSMANAKRVVAKMMLQSLCSRGYRVPAKYACRQAMVSLMDQAGLPIHSFVVLVRELCRKFRLDEVEYQVFADNTGQKSYTVKARIGYVERIATGSSKRIARNLAAEQIYRHLRTMLHAPNFHEEKVLYRAYERAMVSDDEETDTDSSDEDTTLQNNIDEDTSDEDTTDDQTSNQKGLQDEAAAAPKINRRNQMQENRYSSAAQAAVQASIKLEQEPPDPVEESNEVGFARVVRNRRPARLSTEAGAYRPLDRIVAMNFIYRTIERLGI